MITELMLAKYCGAYLPSVPKPLVQTLAHIGKYYTPKFIEKAVRMTCTVHPLTRQEHAMCGECAVSFLWSKFPLTLPQHKCDYCESVVDLPALAAQLHDLPATI